MASARAKTVYSIVLKVVTIVANSNWTGRHNFSTIVYHKGLFLLIIILFQKLFPFSFRAKSDPKFTVFNCKWDKNVGAKLTWLSDQVFVQRQSASNPNLNVTIRDDLLCERKPHRTAGNISLN